MRPLQVIKSTIISEINQKQTLQRNLVLKVLSSKRLLVDHVEIIEDSLNDLTNKEANSTSCITFLKTSAVLATSYVVFIHLKQKYLIPSVSSAVPILYVQKLINSRKRRSSEAKLAKLISNLDNYESAIKKNKTFLHEVQIIKATANVLKRYDKDNRIPHNLVQSMKNVINALYSFVKDLETYAIAEKLSLVYEPFEDLQDCDLMTVNLEEEIIDLKVIKDFFNIFAYVQSQVLLRFALIAVSDVEECKLILKTKFDGITDMVQLETANISKFLDIISSVSQIQTNIQRQIDREISMTMPKELREVRSGSMKFSAKILTVAMQCQHLEELIVKFAEKFEHPDNKAVDEIMAMMKSVENELSVGIDEHKRIAISFQKSLNMGTEEVKMSQDKLDVAEGDKKESSSRRVTEDDVTDQADDFFFVDGSTADTQDDSKSQQAESIEVVNSKLAKKYFKPVLVQLKERIEVIGEDMKERERKVLKAKGIEIDNEPEVARVPSYDDDGGDSGSDDERERKRKFKRNEEKFSGNRDFLESKQPINFFGAGGFPVPPKGQALNEDVLE